MSGGPEGGGDLGGQAPVVQTQIEGDPAGGAAPAAPVWTEGFSEEALGFVGAKEWGGAGDLLESYQNLEKMVGLPADQLVKLPSTPEDEAWGDIYGKLGRPEDAAGYDFPEFEVAEGGPDIAKDFRDYAFGAGLSQRQARGAVDWLAERSAAQATSQNEARLLQSEQEMTALRSEWGQAYNENVEMGKRFATHFGIGMDGLEKLEGALGTAEMMRFAAKIGRAMGEGTPPPAGEDTLEFGVTPAAALNKKAQLLADPQFHKRYMAGDKAAVAEMQRVLEAAHPE